MTSLFDESGISLLPVTRRTWSPRGTTPILRHRCNWKRASMAGALGYHAADPARGPRLCFHTKKDSYDIVALIEVLTQLGGFYAGERVVLLWDGLGAHRSRAMRDWVATQDGWLTVERLPSYAPELNPVGRCCVCPSRGRLKRQPPSPLRSRHVVKRWTQR